VVDAFEPRRLAGVVELVGPAPRVPVWFELGQEAVDRAEVDAVAAGIGAPSWV